MKKNDSKCSSIFKSLTKHLRRDIKEEHSNIAKEKHRIKEDKDSIKVIKSKKSSNIKKTKKK
jgi:hypothetical protein